MPGKKKQPKRIIKDTVTIDGFDLCWELYREPQYTPERGYVGVRILAKLAQGTRRELLLEYPFPKKNPEGFVRLPEPVKISAAVVETDIRRAMDAGWNPASRGKMFVFQVPENPG
jgi:hypothetical protein